MYRLILLFLAITGGRSSIVTVNVDTSSDDISFDKCGHCANLCSKLCSSLPLNLPFRENTIIPTDCTVSNVGHSCNRICPQLCREECDIKEHPETASENPERPEMASENLERPEMASENLGTTLHKIRKIWYGNTVISSVRYSKYPWMAALYLNGRFFCGASLINDKYVLTAGHCVQYSLQGSDYKIRLAIHDLDSDNYDEYNVKRIIRHENYRRVCRECGNVLNDIALVRLDTEGVRTSAHVFPVLLPVEGLSYANEEGVVTGWGETENAIISNLLREAKIKILSNSDCKSYYSVNENQICAGRRDDLRSTCTNDSGGPLTVANGSAHYLVGITSFGRKCGQPPAVYTRVSKYLDWIRNNTMDV